MRIMSKTSTQNAIKYFMLSPENLELRYVLWRGEILDFRKLYHNQLSSVHAVFSHMNKNALFIINNDNSAILFTQDIGEESYSPLQGARVHERCTIFYQHKNRII